MGGLRGQTWKPHHGVHAPLTSTGGVGLSTPTSHPERMPPLLEYKEGNDKCGLLLSKGLHRNLRVACHIRLPRLEVLLDPLSLLWALPNSPHSADRAAQPASEPQLAFSSPPCSPLITSSSSAVVPRSWRLLPGPKVSLQSPGRHGNRSIVMLSPE